MKRKGQWESWGLASLPLTYFVTLYKSLHIPVPHFRFIDSFSVRFTRLFSAGSIFCFLYTTYHTRCQVWAGILRHYGNDTFWDVMNACVSRSELDQQIQKRQLLGCVLLAPWFLRIGPNISFLTTKPLWANSSVGPIGRTTHHLVGESIHKAFYKVQIYFSFLIACHMAQRPFQVR